MMLKELLDIEKTVGDRTGWDFSIMKVETDPIPWDYVDLVRRYIKPIDFVLDVGTGGGERFLELASSYGKGIGIDNDSEMIKTANQKVPFELKEKVIFEVMEADNLTFVNDTFDVVIDRQGPVPVKQIVRVLKPRGYFITQTIGKNNMSNINREFESDSYPKSELGGEASLVALEFENLGCSIVSMCSYDVDYYVKDVASLLFWLKAIRSHEHAASAIPEDFCVEKYYKQINNLITKYKTDRGIRTNEHRELLIIRK